MRYLALISKAVLFLLLLSFAASNSETVTLRYLLGASWQAPLALLLLIAFAAGLVLGLLAGTGPLLKCKGEVSHLRKLARTRETGTQG